MVINWKIKNSYVNISDDKEQTNVSVQLFQIDTWNRNNDIYDALLSRFPINFHQPSEQKNCVIEFPHIALCSREKKNI